MINRNNLPLEDKPSVDEQTLVENAKTTIQTILYITLATSDNDNNPWNSPVYCAFDDDLNFYWMSATDSQHSINIRHSEKAFAVIYDSTVPHGKGFGVYINGTAIEYNENNINKIEQGIQALGERINSERRPTAQDYLSPNPRRIYGFIPNCIWANVFVQENGKFIDKRIEITDKLKQAFSNSINPKK